MASQKSLFVFLVALSALATGGISSAQITGEVNFYAHVRHMTDPSTGDYCGSWGAGCMEAIRYDGSVLIWDHNVAGELDQALIEMSQSYACDVLPWPWDWLCTML